MGTLGSVEAPPELGTLGGAERVVQPADVSRVGPPTVEGAGPRGGTSVQSEAGFKVW